MLILLTLNQSLVVTEETSERKVIGYILRSHFKPENVKTCGVAIISIEILYLCIINCGKIYMVSQNTKYMGSHKNKRNVNPKMHALTSM